MANYFLGHGLLIKNIVFLSPEEANFFLGKEATLVDLREGLERNGREFKVSRIIALPFKRLEAEFATLPRDRPLILGDCVGLNSKEGARFLMGQGYDSVAVLNGGMVNWEQSHMPTEIDRDEELTGSCTCQLRPRKVYRRRSGC